MKDILVKIANILSAIFYPLWIPSYGMILFCCVIQQTMPLPLHYWFVMVGMTLLLTGLLPIFLILYQVKRGYIEDIYIHKREERTLAYLGAVMGFGAWWYLLAHIVNAPSWLSATALGGTVAIALVALINRWWKISAHLTGMGGLLGGICTFALTYQTLPVPLLITILILTLLVMYARLGLNAHTQWQVIAGLALGMACTILIPLVYV